MSQRKHKARRRQERQELMYFNQLLDDDLMIDGDDDFALMSAFADGCLVVISRDDYEKLKTYEKLKKGE